MGHTPGPYFYDLRTESVGCPAGWIARVEHTAKGDGKFGNQDDDGELLAAAPELLAACDASAALPDEAQEIMRREGFVIDNLDDRWQKFAFTLYTMIAENASNADAAIAKATRRRAPGAGGR